MISSNEHLLNKRFFKSTYFRGLSLALTGAALMSLKLVLIKIAYQFGGNVQSAMLLRAISSLPIYLFVLFTLLINHDKKKPLKQRLRKTSSLRFYVAKAILHMIKARITLGTKKKLHQGFPPPSLFASHHNVIKVLKLQRE